MGIDPATVDLGTALDAHTVFPGIHALQRSRDIPEFRTRLVPQGIDDFTVLQLLGAFLGVRMVPPTQVLRDPLEANRKLLLLLLEPCPEGVVGISLHRQ